ERVGGDAAAIAQPRRQLAIIDGAPAERGFRKAGAPAVIRNFLEQLLCVHCPSPPRDAGPRKPPHPRLVMGIVIGAASGLANQTWWAAVNHNSAHSVSGQDSGQNQLPQGMREQTAPVIDWLTCECDAISG